MLLYSVTFYSFNTNLAASSDYFDPIVNRYIVCMHV